MRRRLRRRCPKIVFHFYTRRRWPGGGAPIRAGGEMGGGGGGQGGSSKARRRSGGRAKSSLETPGRPDPLYALAEGAWRRCLEVSAEVTRRRCPKNIGGGTRRRCPVGRTGFYWWFPHAAIYICMKASPLPPAPFWLVAVWLVAGLAKVGVMVIDANIVRHSRNAVVKNLLKKIQNRSQK